MIAMTKTDFITKTALDTFINNERKSRIQIYLIREEHSTYGYIFIILQDLYKPVFGI